MLVGAGRREAGVPQRSPRHHLALMDLLSHAARVTLERLGNCCWAWQVYGATLTVVLKFAERESSDMLSAVPK